MKNCVYGGNFSHLLHKKFKLGLKNKNPKKAKRAACSFIREFKVRMEHKLLELGQYMLTHVDCRMK